MRVAIGSTRSSESRARGETTTVMVVAVVRAMASTTTTTVKGVTVGRSRRAVRVGTNGRVKATRVRAGVEDASTVNPELGVSCSIDDPSSCSLADLELMYVDALWNYYNGGKFTLSDEDYDRLREELNWQGSGFPTLRRYEIEFVQAAISYSRGDPIVDDEKYEELKRRVKAEGKRTDVTALLLFVKGKELLDEAEFELLGNEMKKLGIDVGIRGATCTLSATSPALENDTGSVITMYSALAAVPLAVGLAPSILLGLLGVHVPGGLSVGFAVALCLILTAKLINYTNLQNAEILVGNCPCCEMPIKQFFGGEKPATTFDHKCTACGTSCVLNREKRLIETAGGLSRA